ncbi:serine/threonine-protein phosphatase 6 regulatory ankyrin repeat subunit C-like [Clytia hemisphaerica]|uniref:serine/threonine-protein phosphatase 6 regulatory ankyrin repeat subunit C-like n=1 Tax=Clytia hemisphaerica TaxID=252671 RepID=UPI0034D5726E
MDLITACEHNNQEEVEHYLNRHPEDLNKTFKKHFEEATPLYFAAQYGHLGIVNLLLKKGANADLCCTKKNRIPLHVACFSGFVNVIKFLAKKTSDVNLPDSQGLTPFHLACQSGTQSCVEAIISGGCNVYAQDSLGRTGLDLLLHEDNLKIVRVLLSRYPDLIEKQSQEGRNSFHYASQVGALVCLRHMIQYFRDRALATDNEGRLPVHYAALYGHAPVVKEFLVKGIFQVNEADSFCRTVAHHAAKSSSFETLHITLEHNADLTIQDRNGNTVQHLACMNKPVPEMLVCLKNHGADFDTLENETHDTPLYSARKAANLHNLEKALRDELKCRHCEEREAKEQREASRRRLTVHKKISDHGIGLYESSLPNTRYVFFHKNIQNF